MGHLSLIKMFQNSQLKTVKPKHSQESLSHAGQPRKYGGSALWYAVEAISLWTSFTTLQAYGCISTTVSHGLHSQKMY